MTSENKTKVVVPVYKESLDHLEMKSFKSTYDVLANYPIVILCPESLDTSELQKAFPRVEFMRFSDHFFKDIAGYNQLMISPDFYQRFLDSDTEYILVCQLDAYLFHDNLAYFTAKGYDYVGAPYLTKRLYTIFPFLKYIKSSKKKYRKLGITWQQNDNTSIGNGGLSLRKIKSFYATCLKYPDRIEVYNTHQGISSVYNEDVFWSREPNDFNYPSVEEALLFSFDKYPKLCFEKNGYKLPMGCHGWYKWKWRSFWKKHIDFE